MKNEIEGYLIYKEVQKLQFNRHKIAKGLREFIIDGQSFWAINYKNALKKYNKTLTTK